MSCDPTVNGFTANANYVLDQDGHQLSELGMDSNGNMAWQHTNVYADGMLPFAGVGFLSTPTQKSSAPAKVSHARPIYH